MVNVHVRPDDDAHHHVDSQEVHVVVKAQFMHIRRLHILPVAPFQI